MPDEYMQNLVNQLLDMLDEVTIDLRANRPELMDEWQKGNELVQEFLCNKY